MWYDASNLFVKGIRKNIQITERIVENGKESR